MFLKMTKDKSIVTTALDAHKCNDMLSANKIEIVTTAYDDAETKATFVREASNVAYAFTLRTIDSNDILTKIGIPLEVRDVLLTAVIAEVIHPSGYIETSLNISNPEEAKAAKEEAKKEFLRYRDQLLTPKIKESTDETDIIRKKLYCNVYNNAIKKSSKFIAVNEAEFAVAKFDRFFNEK